MGQCPMPVNGFWRSWICDIWLGMIEIRNVTYFHGDACAETHRWLRANQKDNQFDNFVVNGGTVSCRNDNLRYHLWRQNCQIDDLLFPVIRQNTNMKILLWSVCVTGHGMLLKYSKLLSLKTESRFLDQKLGPFHRFYRWVDCFYIETGPSILYHLVWHYSPAKH